MACPPKNFIGWKSVHYQPLDPGTKWLKNPDIVIDVRERSGMWRIITPNVVERSGGGFRIYYTESGPGMDYGDSPGRILSAYSDDGDVWEQEPGFRLEPHPPHAGLRVVCPDVVPLPGGGLRMYFEGQPFNGPSAVLSAISEDGLVWEPEGGVRYGDGVNAYGSPRCVYLDSMSDDRSFQYRLYFHSYSFPMKPGVSSSNHIISAISEDGLHFEREGGVRIAQESDLESYSVYAPEVLRLGDGTYRIYYAGWSSDPVRGRIFSAVSENGLDWTKDREPNIVFGGRWDRIKCSEPCIARLRDERYKMFYEASGEDGIWRILCATSA